MPSFAQDLEAARQAIEDALPGTLIHNPLAVEWESRGDDKKIKIIKAETSTGQALSARVKKRKQKPWDVLFCANQKSRFWERNGRVYGVRRPQ